MVVSFTLYIMAGDTPRLGKLNLESQGPTYTVTYSFTTDCPAESLFLAFMRPEHIIACMKRANLRIEVIDTAPLRNRIVYTYSYIISELRLRFDRYADTAARLVGFTMEACSTSGSSIIPTVRSSHGYYKITPQGDSCRVDYWQQTTLDRDLIDFYLFFIRRDTRRVLNNQRRYVSNRERWMESDRQFAIRRMQSAE
jgi:hypothetical protein